MKIWFYKLMTNSVPKIILNMLIVLLALPSIFWGYGIVYILNHQPDKKSHIAIWLNSFDHKNLVLIVLFLITIFISALSRYTKNKMVSLSTKKFGKIIDGLYYARYYIALLIVFFLISELTIFSIHFLKYYMLVIILAQILRAILEGVEENVK